MRRSNPIEEFLYPEGRRLDSPNPIGEKVSKKFEQGGFIPTPSYGDITSLREANAWLTRELDVLRRRVVDLEVKMDAVRGYISHQHEGGWTPDDPQYGGY